MVPTPARGKLCFCPLPMLQAATRHKNKAGALVFGSPQRVRQVLDVRTALSSEAGMGHVRKKKHVGEEEKGGAPLQKAAVVVRRGPCPEVWMSVPGSSSGLQSGNAVWLS